MIFDSSSSLLSSPPPSYLPWLRSFSTSYSNSTILVLRPLDCAVNCSIIASFLSISSSFSSKKFSNCCIFSVNSNFNYSIYFLCVYKSFFNDEIS